MSSSVFLPSVVSVTLWLLSVFLSPAESGLRLVGRGVRLRLRHFFRHRLRGLRRGRVSQSLHERRQAGEPLAGECQVQLVPPGVYVAMHNQVLQFPGVTKDRSAGTFVKEQA